MQLKYFVKKPSETEVLNFLSEATFTIHPFYNTLYIIAEASFFLYPNGLTKILSAFSMCMSSIHFLENTLF